MKRETQDKKYRYEEVQHRMMQMVARAWDKKGEVLLCGSFSKTLAPGYRVGWLAAGRFREQAFRLKIMVSLASASPTQLAVAEFLHSGGYEHHLRHIRRIYAKKTAAMADTIHRHFPAGTRITRPQGGFTLWVEMPESVNSMVLYEKAMAEGISIAPGSLFSTTSHFSHYVRLNAAAWSDRNAWAVETLGKTARTLMDSS
ncbi:PLP-dependent aminotransferase family protein [Desulfobotulus mexicanus]|uniref:PLP-dependent aminotransferase family protein n=1 Tax=Desulfobotulus mexicanus TaxID=2586642 RepID=A0A5Q4VE91_9BACT|nr:PLP-dependent aminotransferase family protein [Desulfobotulus mexicanus]TYT75283.1 PLP-dependent aminotransferase family protein [Desulfobotulus mexicanus]